LDEQSYSKQCETTIFISNIKSKYGITKKRGG